MGKILLYLLGLLGLFGMLGTGYIMVRDAGKEPPRPDLGLNALVAELGIEGRLSILVVRNKFPIYDAHWPKDEVTAETAYPLGSLGGIFTASAVQILHDEGQLDLDKPLADYLPETQLTVTAAQLLTHTDDLNQEHSDRLLERLVEQVSGMTVPEFVEQKIKTPLAAAREAKRADPELDLTLTGLNWQPESGKPGQWVACARDLKRWELSLNTGLLVRLETHLRAFSPPKKADGTRHPYGFGWEISNYNGLRLEEWVADETGFGANLTRFSEKNFALVILTDQPRSVLDTRVLARQIADLYLSREFPRHRGLPHD